MPDSLADREAGRGNSPNIVRSLFGLFVFAVIGVYFLSDIPGEISRWKMAAARSQAEQNDLQQALETSAAAQAWDPGNLNAGLTRAALYQSQGDHTSALQVIDEMLATSAGNQEFEIRLLKERAELLQVLGRHEEAIAAADRRVEYEKEFIHPFGADELHNLSAYNMRAYVVARAAAAGRTTDEQKGQALAEIGDVLRIWHRDRESLGASSPILAQQLEYRLMEVMFLDTYAYLRLFSGKQYHQFSLRDLNRCVESCDHIAALALDLAQDDGNYLSMNELAKRVQASKAAIIFHRGEAYTALGNTVASADDRRTAKALGYDRTAGIW